MMREVRTISAVAGGDQGTKEGLAPGGPVQACDWLDLQYGSVDFLGIAISTIKGLDKGITFRNNTCMYFVDDAFDVTK